MNKNKSGKAWTKQEKLDVWHQSIGNSEKGKDACGATVKYSEHGQRTDYGWHIDHISPVAHGGSDDLSNLQVLHWKNNEYKADRLDNKYCVKSD